MTPVRVVGRHTVDNYLPAGFVLGQAPCQGRRRVVAVSPDGPPSPFRPCPSPRGPHLGRQDDFREAVLAEQVDAIG
jgi:hypothetical protein